MSVQSKIGKLTYPHKDVVRDVRMRAFDYLDETFDWSQEDMYSLITQGGTAAKPEDHKVCVGTHGALKLVTAYTCTCYASDVKLQHTAQTV